MDAHTLTARIAAGKAPAILDVRSRREFVRGHVPGAVNVPFWAALIGRPRGLRASSDPLVVYCGRGPRAWLAAAALRLRGLTVRSLEGHMSGWERRGLPVERGPDRP
jgi:rhodanese-related sulfurtransferase